MTFCPPEAKAAAPSIFTQNLRSVVLPIVVLEPEGNLHPIGSCFIVSCSGKEALALTAKHNIEYIMRLDGYRPMHAPPEFRVFEFHAREPVNITMFVAYWLSGERMIPCQLPWFPGSAWEPANTRLCLVGSSLVAASNPDCRGGASGKCVPR